MKHTLARWLTFAALAASTISHAQDFKGNQKPKMIFMGAYDSGQPGANIYKMFDPTEDVVCYILMPEVAGRKQIDTGKWIYDGNTVGSISCLKTKVQVTPIPSATQQKR